MRYLTVEKKASTGRRWGVQKWFSMLKGTNQMRGEMLGGEEKKTGGVWGIPKELRRTHIG